jgi:hypothetical protein
MTRIAACVKARDDLDQIRQNPEKHAVREASQDGAAHAAMDYGKL